MEQTKADGQERADNPEAGQERTDSLKVEQAVSENVKKVEPEPVKPEPELPESVEPESAKPEPAEGESPKPEPAEAESPKPEPAEGESPKPERTDLEELETAVEAILFASGEPVKMDRICLALGLEPALAERVLHRLKDYYAFERRGIRLLQMEDAWQLCSSPDYADAVRRAFEIRKPAKLTQPALEVLTIFAYYQPTTRAYVDKLRGVDSSYTVSLLLERKLIEPCGRLQVPGRPHLYRTTKQFLRAFHLTSLDDLPPLPEGGERLRPEEQAAILAAEGADATLLTTKPPEDADSVPSARSGDSAPSAGNADSAPSAGNADSAASAGSGDSAPSVGSGDSAPSVGSRESAERTEPAGTTAEKPDSANSKDEILNSETGTVEDAEDAAVSEEGELPEGAISMEGADDDTAVDTGYSGAPAVPAGPDAGADSGVHAGERTVPVPADWTGAGASVSPAGETGEEKAGKEEKEETGGGS